MLKVTEWLIGGVVALAIWIAALLNIGSYDLSAFELVLIRLLPIWGLIAFGVISLAIIAFRTATLRDCPEAEVELKQEITEAKADLKRKGFKF